MNTAPILFSEVQRFRQWWLLSLIGVLPALFAWAFVQQIIFDVPWGNNPTSDGWLLVFVAVFGLGLPAFILSINLRTEVRPDGIYVQFWPLHRGWVHIPAETIHEFTAHTYRPIMDYGGWGIRWGLKGKVYSVSGNRGVLLVYGNRHRLLIGSQRADELEQAIATACGRS
ncbi:MAG: DUF6141 family protein [Chloroflexota bacterium]